MLNNLLTRKILKFDNLLNIFKAVFVHLKDNGLTRFELKLKLL